MSNHFQTIYARHADQYEALVRREDYQGVLGQTLSSIAKFSGASVIEFGAGTGRVTRIMRRLGATVTALDLSLHMLSEAARIGVEDATLAVGDNRAMPIRAACSDVTLAGWSFGHATGWSPDGWQAEIGLMLAEMTRITRPGGTQIIIETLGTGQTEPNPPNEALAAYYTWLERDHGFTRLSIRTDYQFDSMHEAESLVRFFFGDGLAQEVVSQRWVVLPECTGVWWRRR